MNVEHSTTRFGRITSLFMRFAHFALLLCSGNVFAATLPFVGCAADGHGPIPAPPPRKIDLAIPEAAARQLAWFESGRFGTLGPRGWHCFEVYGSGEASLWIAPQRLTFRDFFSGAIHFDGPVIALVRSSGDTGRFDVASLIPGTFPAHLEFVNEVVREFDYRPPQQGPWPTDIVTHRGSEFVEYTTPANTEGLGTDHLVVRGTRPIRGFAQLFLPDYDLVQLRVRLPEALDHLAPVIVKQAAADVKARADARRTRQEPNR